MTNNEGFNLEIQNALREPTPHERVNFRVGFENKEKGYAVMLAYIDARYVQDRLDEIVGASNWEVEYIEVAGNMFCAITIRWPEGQVTRKMDVGIETDVEKEKGQASDAFKRSAVMYGIGRDLYGYPKHYADLDSGGKVPYDWKPAGWGDTPSNGRDSVMSGDQINNTTNPSPPPKTSMKQADVAQKPDEEETLKEMADRVTRKAAETAPDKFPEGYDDKGLKTGTPPEQQFVLVKNLKAKMTSQKGAVLYIPPEYSGDVDDHAATKKYWVGAGEIQNEDANMNGLFNVTIKRWKAEQNGYVYEELSEQADEPTTEADEPVTLSDDDLPF